MSLKTWLERQAPDFLATGQRFPFAILLAALVTAVGIVLINAPGGEDGEPLLRLWGGLATGAVLAVAGVMFSESRPQARLAGLALRYVVPLLAVALFQVRDIGWFVPWLLPAIAVLWLSVSPFTVIERDEAREDAQNMFWWVNHQAVATAAIAALAFGIIAVGLLAIERSLSLLFGLEANDLFYKWVLPITGMFLTPVYWLSTLPKVQAFRRELLDQPDFTSTAVGFLGQFILVPLLLIYAAILLAYTAQIVITQQLPQGMIGWMVLGFVIAGAATWLVLHPPFMRRKPLVRLFRKLWFWLTLVPLALFFYAVAVRVDAYGFTTERLLLLAGGVWAAILAAAFLLRRGDIRLIPALAGAILLLLSMGPWNVVHLPLSQQLMRLEALIASTVASPDADPTRRFWNTEAIADAAGSIDYLVGTAEGRQGVRDVMAKFGVTWDAAQDGSHVVFEAMGVGIPGGGQEMVSRIATLFRDFDGSTIDTSAFPFLIRPVGLYGNTALDVPPLRFWLQDGDLRVGPALTPDAELVPLDLSGWTARQTGAFLVDPWIDFVASGRNYRLVVQSVTIDRGENNAGPVVLSSLEGQLFSDTAR